MLLKRIGEQIKKFASESVTWLRTEEEVTDQISVEIQSTLVQLARANPNRSHSEPLEEL